MNKNKFLNFTKDYYLVIIIFSIIIFLLFSYSMSRADKPLLKLRENHLFGINSQDSYFNKQFVFKIPDSNNPKKIPTLNKKGFMAAENDPFSQEFIDYANKVNYPVLEIGTAYGIATIPVLKKGVTVIANDIDARHLLILREKTPHEFRKNLYLKQGYFPSELNFPENSFGAILICRVAHFLTGEELEKGLKKIYKWLVPGGKLFFISMAPSHHLLKEKFFPVYEENFNKGYKWPGMIYNMKELNPKEAKDIPDFLHVVDEKVMQKALQEIGFIIEKISLFDYNIELRQKRNDMGYLGLIAIKPSN